MVKRVDDVRKYDSHGAHYAPLPMCADCTRTSLVRVLRADGWANLCTLCYVKHSGGSGEEQKINEWKGPTEYGRKVSAEIRAKLKAFVHQRPSKKWAPRVLERAAAGEKIAPYAIELAREVVGARTPGEDDE